MKIRLILHDYVRSVGSHLSWKYSENNKCQRGIQRNFFCCWRPQYVSDGYNTWLLNIWCDINKIHKCVNSYVSRLDTTDGKEQILIGTRHTPPFFRRHGHPRTHTQVSEDKKTPINLPSNIFLQLTWWEGTNWKIRSSALQEICTWRQEKFFQS